jgi:phosphate transport system substrate-binding protein
MIDAMRRIGDLSRMMACLGLFFVMGCGNGSSGRAFVAIDGSSSLYPISEAISEEFQLQNPRVMVTAGRSGTGGGFERFCLGETDISAASRPILESEARQCQEMGVDYLDLQVALDGISVIVSSQNDFVECLTVEELRRIWRPGSRVRTWRDVRPDLPGREIRLYGPGSDSGTYDFFTERIVGEARASRTDFQASEDDNVLVQGITGDPYALGFFGFGYLAGNSDRLKAVEVDNGSGCVGPSVETIQDGSYAPLIRDLFIYVNRASLRRPGVSGFLEFFLDADSLISSEGFAPVPESTYRENREELARLAGEAGER